MEYHWLDLFYLLQLFEIYYKNSPPPPECLQMLIDAQKDIEQQKQYNNEVLENFKNENKCFTNN